MEFGKPYVRRGKGVHTVFRIECGNSAGRYEDCFYALENPVFTNCSMKAF